MEVIDDGVTGYVVNSVEEALATLPRLLSLDRHRVREKFEERFTATRMAKSYLSLYARSFATTSRLPARTGDLKPPRETAVN
jgi:hypothetical protein